VKGQELRYALDVGRRRAPGTAHGSRAEEAPVPRIARLLALAIRLEKLVREGEIRDYAEAARLGGVTRARMTQIMKLVDLAPDIQEEILYRRPAPGLNERNLRTIVSRIDWREQRSLFRALISRGSSF
jgi:hypothetical protein